MRQKKSNKFNSLYITGLAVLLVPIGIAASLVIMYVLHNNKETPTPKEEPIQKEKVIEKVYIHDTVKIPCNRRHCDDHIAKPKTETPAVTVTKTDTL